PLEVADVRRALPRGVVLPHARVHDGGDGAERSRRDQPRHRLAAPERVELGELRGRVAGLPAEAAQQPDPDRHGVRRVGHAGFAQRLRIRQVALPRREDRLCLDPVRDVHPGSGDPDPAPWLYPSRRELRAAGEAVTCTLPMAGAVLAARPALLVYVVFGRYFVRGLLAGSVKG